MSKRARKGGQQGLNGEFYKGGTFLPSTRLPKQGASARVERPKTALVAPGVVAPLPLGHVAVFGQVAHFIRVTSDGQLEPKFADGHVAVQSHFGDDLARLHGLIALWNRGVRTYPAGETPWRV